LKREKFKREKLKIKKKRENIFLKLRF